MRRALLVGVFALALLYASGCSRIQKTRVPQRCVDEEGRAVDDRYCEEDARREGYGRPGFVYRYHWYWGGGSSYVPPGSVIRGGTYTAPDPESVDVFSPTPSGARPTGVAISPRTAAERGLFGSSAHEFGESGVSGHAGAGE